MRELLLDQGADIEIRDPDRNTMPIRYAIVFCQPDMILSTLRHRSQSQRISAVTIVMLAINGSAQPNRFR